jgi:hypothetical protein
VKGKLVMQRLKPLKRLTLTPPLRRQRKMPQLINPSNIANKQVLKKAVLRDGIFLS